MKGNLNSEQAASLIREICKLPTETEWLELKHNDHEPDDVGEYISAIANSAALVGKPIGYVVWGIEDDTHNILGTTFSPRTEKKGNEELENWLLRSLEPKINFRFSEFLIDLKPVVLLEIEAAFRHPVSFKGQEFIRVGSYKKKLKDFPEKERDLWRTFDQTPFENLIAAENVSDSEVLDHLDFGAYFSVLGLHTPLFPEQVLEALENDELIRKTDGGIWDITNLGALLFGKSLRDYQSLRRKVVRVIEYEGVTRIEAKREQVIQSGYAIGFEPLIAMMGSILPMREVIDKAVRRSAPVYPQLAVREIVANALIHQDLSLTGTGPMIEVFDDRLEVSNPGAPLVNTERLLDSPPRSRNEALASFMRRIGYCEERGGGVDKVVFETEFHQLPAPIFEKADENTRVVLFGPRPASRMDKADRVRACYWHACLKYVNRDFLTNASVRERFGISKDNNSVASRYIREAVDEGSIKPFDENAPPKLRKYVPFWVDN